MQMHSAAGPSPRPMGVPHRPTPLAGFSGKKCREGERRPGDGKEEGNGKRNMRRGEKGGEWNGVPSLLKNPISVPAY